MNKYAFFTQLMYYKLTSP